MRLCPTSSLLLFAFQTASLAGTPSGTVTAVDKKEAVVLEAGGARRGLAAGILVGDGDSIKTRSGRVEIRLAPGSFLWIAPKSWLVIKKQEGKMVLYLRKGKLAMQLSGAVGATVEISMDYGTVRGRGRAAFLLSRLQGSAILDVREGVAEARNDGGSRLASAATRLILKRTTILETAPPVATQRGEFRTEFMAWVGLRRELRGPSQH